MTEVCKYCGQMLSMVEEIHVFDGELFCSKDCAVYNKVNKIMQTARITALDAYDKEAETVTPEDIGLTRTNVWTAYSAEEDVTTIFRDTYSKHGFKESTTVIGFYYGEPCPRDTKTFADSLVAVYKED